LLVSARQPGEARTHLERALKLRPVFPEAHLEIGRAYAVEGLHESALKSYDEALKQRKEDVLVLMQKAHSYGAMGRRKDAKVMLRAAIGLRPEFWEPRYLLAIELAADNELPEAILQFNEVTRLRPNYAQAYFNLSVALAKTGKLREAHLGFQKTLELDPEHKSAREYLGAMEREYGQ
jgi:tetratricopeptide (TPR) repeat protein